MAKAAQQAFDQCFATCGTNQSKGVGAALLICGELKVEETLFLELVTDKGERILPPKNIGSPATDYSMNRFLWPWTGV